MIAVWENDEPFADELLALARVEHAKKAVNFLAAAYKNAMDPKHDDQARWMLIHSRLAGVPDISKAFNGIVKER